MNATDPQAGSHTAPSPDDLAPLHALGIGHDERLVYAKLASPRAAADVAAQLRMGVGEVERVLDRS